MLNKQLVKNIVEDQALQSLRDKTDPTLKRDTKLRTKVKTHTAGTLLLKTSRQSPMKFNKKLADEHKDEHDTEL